MIYPLYIPALNPIRLIRAGHKYFSLFNESIPFHEEAVCYYQKFSRYDILAFQACINKNTYNDFFARLIDQTGRVALTITGEEIIPSGGNRSYVEFRSALTGVDEGVYYLEVFFEKGELYSVVSEPILIKDQHPDTILIEFGHRENDFDMYFMGGRKFWLRVEGGFPSSGFTPGAKDTVYRNQEHDTVLLNSTPYSVQKIQFGSGSGIPNWVADKINRIFSCSSTKINGVSWVKNEGAKMEAARESSYPLAGWTLELIDTSNRYSDVFGSGDFNEDFSNDFNNL